MSTARTQGGPGQEMEEGGSDVDDGGNISGPGGNGGGNTGNMGTPSTPPSGGRTRGSRSATMGSDEWSRQRKDNHVSGFHHLYRRFS